MIRKIFRISFSHTIHRLSFGEEFPEIVNPLDGMKKTASGLNE